jgi:hypothetical protein
VVPQYVVVGERLAKPTLVKKDSLDPEAVLVEATHQGLGKMAWFCERPRAVLFAENETNFELLYGGRNHGPYPKDGINDHILKGAQAVNPAQQGTKASAHYQIALRAGETRVIKLRLTNDLAIRPALGEGFDEVFTREIQRADEFYGRIAIPEMSVELKSIQRQAFAGLL